MDNNHIFLGVSSSGEPGFSWGLMESFDNGNTWSEVNSSILGCFDISINPENPQNIWIINYNVFFDFWLMYSDDGGLSWNLCEGLPFPQSWVMSMYADADFNLYAESQINGNEDISKAVLKSSDQGESWTEVDKLQSREFNYDINLSKKCQADPTNTDNIYFGNHYGVFHSVDGGISNQYQNSGLMNSYIFDIEVNPKNHDVIYAAGSQGLWKSEDGGKNWQIILQEKINVVKCNPQHPDTIYIGGFDLWRSYDGGTNLEKIDPSNTYYHKVIDIDINPKETNILYCGQGGYYMSLDYGNSWEPISIAKYDKSTYYDFIIDPNHTDTLYMAEYRSTDRGETWEETFERRIIGVHPQNSNIIYASSGNFETIDVSYDWGGTFQTIAQNSTGPFPNLNIYSFQISSENPDYLFYSTRNDKVFYSLNGGNDWQQLQGGYDTRVTDIIPMVNENKYFLATHGDGVWIYDTTYITSTERKVTGEQNNHLKASPNPFSIQTNISYDIRGTGLVNLAVYDLQGQLINTLVNENKTNGKYETLWNGKDKTGKEVKKGLYLIRLESGGDFRFCKVVLSG
ncbi:MAG: T9SS type A sorting domain-containing protein [Bacteroidales bacterium]